MIFAGETVDSLKLGTLSPLYKDVARFRPITLLEPIYKCCMASMSRRLAQLLYNLSILHPAQYGFVADGSCLEPLSVTNSMYENSLATDKPLHLAYLDATSAFDSIQWGHMLLLMRHSPALGH